MILLLLFIGVTDNIVVETGNETETETEQEKRKWKP